MRHRFKKAKFGHGQDANQMLVRKLVTNFLVRGTLTTTKQKAKATQSVVERLVSKSKETTEANKNYILKHITDQAVLEVLYTQIGPALKDKPFGVTRIIRMNARITDGAQIAKLEWAYPVVLNGAKTEDKTSKVRKESKEQKEPKVTETKEEKK